MSISREISRKPSQQIASTFRQGRNGLPGPRKITNPQRGDTIRSNLFFIRHAEERQQRSILFSVNDYRRWHFWPCVLYVAVPVYKAMCHAERRNSDWIRTSFEWRSPTGRKVFACQKVFCLDEPVPYPSTASQDPSMFGRGMDYFPCLSLSENNFHHRLDSKRAHLYFRPFSEHGMANRNQKSLTADQIFDCPTALKG